MSTVPNILEIAETGQADQLWENLRTRALSSLYYFSKVVLGYKDLTESLHLPFCLEVQNNTRTKRGFLLPRGHFKSTIISKSYSLWRVCQNPNLRVLIVGESGPVAAKNLKDIKWQIENSQLFRWLFPELIPANTNSTKWTDTEILLPREQSFDESTITCIGQGAKGTGFHYDLVIYDDMIGLVAAQSKAEMNSAWDWFEAAPGLLNEQKTGEEILNGTRWKHGTADLYGRVMAENPAFKWYIRSAIENNKPIFPERFSIEILDEIRKREGDYLFNCQYMNNPTSPEGADFPPDWIKTYEVGDDGKSVLLEDGRKFYLGQLNRITFYDPSAGGKSAKAENAIVGLGMTSSRDVIVLEPWSKNCSFGDAIEHWHVMNDHFRFYENYYEQIGAQKEVEEIVKERPLICNRCSQTHKRLRPLPFIPPGGKSSMSKEERIRLFAQTAFQEGRVYIRKEHAELRRQITSFPHGDLVDQFDALASGIHLLRPPLSDEEVKEEQEFVQRQRALAKPRTNTTYDYGGY